MAKQAHKKVIIVGGGKSIREEWLCNGLFDLISNYEIWSTNFSYLTMPYYPMRQLWSDKKFYRYQKSDLIQLYRNNVKLTTGANGFQYSRLRQLDGEREMLNKLEAFKSTRDGIQAKNRNEVFAGRHHFTGVFALSIALIEKYNEIYLLGMDYGTSGITDNDTHYYKGFVNPQKNVPEDEEEFTNFGKARPYHNTETKEFIKDYNFFLSDYDKIYNVINPNYESNISTFKKITYNDMYKQLGVNCE